MNKEEREISFELSGQKKNVFAKKQYIC